MAFSTKTKDNLVDFISYMYKKPITLQYFKDDNQKTNNIIF